VDTAGIEPFIDTDYFDVGYGDTSAGERAIDGQYATTTLNVSPVYSELTGGYTEGFFGVNFVDGHIKSYETSESFADFYVRCVRGNTDYGENDFTDNGDGTITDAATGLMWLKDDVTSNSDGPWEVDFETAIDTCEDLEAGGHDDWRLPNMKELHSIVDYTRSPEQDDSPAIDTRHFSASSIINEAGDTDWGAYWSSTALLNFSGNGSKGIYITFGRGMGYQGTSIGPVDVHGAGAQRSDEKDPDNLTGSAFVADDECSFGDVGYSSGPQGDVLRPAYNFVRCVRDAE
jgi:hypothetical protein